MLLPMTAIRPVITGLLFYLSFCSNQAREFGVVLLDLVEDLRAFRLFGKLTDELQIRWRRLDMSRDRCSYTGVGGIESCCLEDLSAPHQSEIDMADVHQVHRSLRQIPDFHFEVEQGLLRAQHDPWRGQIVAAESHDILPFAYQRYIEADFVLAADD